MQINGLYPTTTSPYTFDSIKSILIIASLLNSGRIGVGSCVSTECGAWQTGDGLPIIPSIMDLRELAGGYEDITDDMKM